MSVSATTADASARARAHPLIARLLATPRATELSAVTHEAFARTPRHVLLVFLEDPLRVRETLDLAVIVPEIAAAFAEPFAIGVLLPEAARNVQSRYGFRRWPALVLLRDGGYLGTVDGLRTWDDYANEIARLLTAAPTRMPGLAIRMRTLDPQASARGTNDTERAVR